MSANKCKHTKDGKRCRAYALKGKDYCFSHDPEGREAKLQAVTKGGLVKKIRIEHQLEEIPINCPRDIVKLLVTVINEVRTNKLNYQIANSLGVLSGQLLRAWEVTSTDDKVSEVLDILKGRKESKEGEADERFQKAI